jgi:hypothetical protein
MMTQIGTVDGGSSARKPDVAAAMRDLIQRARATLPFEATEAQVCTGVCQGCSRKLLDFLDSELDDWERRLDAGERPGLGDLSRLIQTSRKVQRVLMRNGLIEDDVAPA